MAIDLNMVGINRDAYKGIGTPSVEFYARSPMQVQMRGDLTNVFFNLGEFGGTCVYQHYQNSLSGYQSAQYQIILDAPTSEEGFGGPVSVTALRKQVQIPLHTMRQYPTVRDRVKVDGTWYLVSEYSDDGVGVVTLFLQRSGSAF